MSVGSSEHSGFSSQYTIERDFGGNLFSLYNPLDESPIFQIDANFGYPAAVIVRIRLSRSSYSGSEQIRMH